MEVPQCFPYVNENENEVNHLLSPVIIAVGYPDESGKSSCQRCSHVGAEGQECGPGCRGHRATEPGYCCRHPVRPVHFPAGGMCQGMRANDLNKSDPKRAEQSSALPLASMKHVLTVPHDSYQWSKNEFRECYVNAWK